MDNFDLKWDEVWDNLSQELSSQHLVDPPEVVANDDAEVARKFRSEAISFAFEDGLPDFTLGQTLAGEDLGTFRVVLYKGHPTQFVKYQHDSCAALLKRSFEDPQNKDRDMGMKLHTSHQHGNLIPHLSIIDEQILRNLVMYADPDVTLHEQPLVKSHQWIKFPCIHFKGQHTHYIVCLDCCTLIKIRSEAGQEVAKNFTKKELTTHIKTCGKLPSVEKIPVSIHFNGYLKIRAEKGFKENSNEFFSRPKEFVHEWKDKADFWDSFETVFQRVEEEEVETNLVKCNKCALVTIFFDATCRKHHAHHLSREAKVDQPPLNITAAKYRAYRERNKDKVEVEEDEDTDFVILDPALNIENKLDIRLFSSLQAQLVQVNPNGSCSQDVQVGASVSVASDSCPSICSQDFDPIVVLPPTKRIKTLGSKYEADYKSLMHKCKVQVFQDFNNGDKVVVAILLTYYNPCDSSMVDKVPVGAINHSKKQLKRFKPLANDPWGRYGDSRYTDNLMFQNDYNSNWNLVWESGTFEAAEGDKELHAFRLAFFLCELAKASDRYSKYKKSQKVKKEPVNRIQHLSIVGSDQVIYIVGCGAQVTMGKYDYQRVEKWLKFFETSLVLKKIPNDDSPKFINHQKNLCMSSLDCHQHPSRSWLCFNRDHVPEKAHGNRNFRHKLISRIVTVYNDKYLVYVDLDPTNVQGSYSANLQSSVQRNTTRHGAMSRDYKPTKTFESPLYYFHHPLEHLIEVKQLEWEGISSVVHLLGQILNVGFNFKTSENPGGFGHKSFLLENEDINLPTTRPDIFLPLIKQVFNLIFQRDISIVRNVVENNFVLDRSLDK